MYMFFRKHVRLFSKVRQTRFFYVHLRVIKELLRNYLWQRRQQQRSKIIQSRAGSQPWRLFFTNERTRFITGLIISILTIYVGLALISFFFTGAADQSKIENVPLGDLLTNRGSVENWTGVRGAYLSDLLMNRWFGISSFMILFFLGSVGAKLMNLNKVSLLRRFLFSASALIWGSVFLLSYLSRDMRIRLFI